ncbi:MAG: hypothetical protein AAFP85_05895 [Pseudomonadota bacterium]
MKLDNQKVSTTCSSTRKTKAPDLWEIVVQRRVGQPPLRFKGQRIAHLRRVVTSNVTIFIDVWARRKGDYVVVHSDLADGSLRQDARIVSDIADVAEHLEGLCHRPALRQQHSDLVDLFPNVLRAVAFRQHFAILVGDFLASLDTYCARRAAP